MGALGYADDVALLAPSLQAAKSMLRICDNFANQFNVLFNASKSVLLVQGDKRQIYRNVKLYLNNQLIEQKSNAVHLGTTIGEKCDQINLKKAAADLYVATNCLMSRFSFCSIDVLTMLFNSYCTAFYGSVLWNLEDIENVEIAWKKCVKRIWRLDVRTRSQYVIHLMKCPLQEMLYVRFLRFFSNCWDSNNATICSIAKQCLLGFSNIKKNVSRCADLINMPPSYVADNRLIVFDALHDKFCPDDELVVHVDIIKELCYIREGTLVWDIGEDLIPHCLEFFLS